MLNLYNKKESTPIMAQNHNTPKDGRNLEQDRMKKPESGQSREREQHRSEPQRERSPRDEQVNRTPRQ